METIDHLNRYVSNVDKFIIFYTDVLSYQLLDKGTKSNGRNYAILQGGGHELFISERDNFMVGVDQNFRHIGYYIENVEELLELLKSKGYVENDKEIIIKPFSKQLYVKDPDGFEIDLIQWTDKKEFYYYLKSKNSK